MSGMHSMVFGQELNSFNDLVEKEFGFNEVQNLTERGIISGFKDGTFRPTSSITRLEAAKLLVDSLQIKGDGKLPDFKDVSKTSHWIPYIDAAIDHGIFYGFEDRVFGTNTTLTREQMASVIVRSYDLKPVLDKNVPLKDLNKASSSHREDIKTLYQNGITLGFNDQTFKPKEPVNRVSFSVFLHRVLKNQVNLIEEVTGNGLSINGVTFTYDETLKGLFSKSNQASLKGAEIRFETKGTNIVKVTELVLNSSGSAGIQAEFDQNVKLDLGESTIFGNLTINGDYFTLENGQINGTLTISTNVKNDFYMSNVTVKGKTTVFGGDSNTVVFDHSNLVDVIVEKLDVRVQFTGQTTVSMVTINKKSVIEADSNIIIPSVNIGENVEHVFIGASVTELTLLSNQKVTLEGLTSVGKLTLPSNVQAADVIANFETIKSIITPKSTEETSREVGTPSPMEQPIYSITTRSFEDVKKNISSQTPYYYSYASVDVYLNALSVKYPNAKSFKVNYLPASNPTLEGITKDLFVIEQIKLAYKGIPNILKEFNLSESTLMQFNILVFDENGTKLDTITHEQLVLDLTEDIELAFDVLKNDWANVTFEKISPFLEKSYDLSNSRMEMFMEEVKLLETPSISTINALIEEVLVADLPLEMYTNVTRYVEPLQVGSLLNGYDNREVLSISSMDSNVLEVNLGMNPRTLRDSYVIIANATGEVDLEVVFKNGTTTETKLIHVEVDSLLDTLTEVNRLILEKHHEEISVNKIYYSDVMKHVLETATELNLTESFLNHYSYLFRFVSTPTSYTHYATIEDLQNEINQITAEVASIDTLEKVLPFTDPVSFNVNTQNEFDVLGYLQGTEFGAFMNDPRMRNFTVETSTNYPLPIGITYESGKLIISDTYLGSVTTVRLKATMQFGDYANYGREFRIGLE